MLGDWVSGMQVGQTIAAMFAVEKEGAWVPHY
jgi:hypothetical protein